MSAYQEMKCYEWCAEHWYVPDFLLMNQIHLSYLIYFYNSNFAIIIKCYWTVTYSSSYRRAITPHQQWTMWAAAAAAAAAIRVVPAQAIRVK